MSRRRRTDDRHDDARCRHEPEAVHVNAAKRCQSRIERAQGREHAKRDIVTVAYRRGIGDPAALFRFDEFIEDNSFRPDIKIHVRGDAGYGLPLMYEICENNRDRRD